MLTDKKPLLALLPLLISTVMVIVIFLLSKLLPPRLPLFYSLPWGEKELVSNIQLLIIPAIITLVTFSNLIISWQLHSSQIFFKKILLFSSILVSLILSITFFKIIYIFL